MIDEDHPFYFLEPLLTRQDATFCFSRYVYTPDTVFDQRELLQVVGPNLNSEWISEQFDLLSPDQELAIHSNVTIGGKTYHIPMLDFATECLDSAQLYRVKRFLPERVFDNFAFYSSGRSYHGYSTRLLQPKEWYSFHGRALLMNPRDREDIVDTRWIGHRLIAGYCSLRFSNNSQKYKGMPKRVSIGAFMKNIPKATPESHDPVRSPS
jgi:hypothetical protein